MNIKTIAQSILPAPANLPTRNWYAWINTMPGGPRTLHVIGEVEVPSIATQPLLLKRSPQGITPTDLLLDLFLVTTGDVGGTQTDWRKVHYSESGGELPYQTVGVHASGERISRDLEVEIIH